MPELPEVESLRALLERRVLSACIQKRADYRPKDFEIRGRGLVKFWFHGRGTTFCPDCQSDADTTPGSRNRRQ